MWNKNIILHLKKSLHCKVRSRRRTGHLGQIGVPRLRWMSVGKENTSKRWKSQCLWHTRALNNQQAWVWCKPLLITLLKGALMLAYLKKVQKVSDAVNKFSQPLALLDSAAKHFNSPNQLLRQNHQPREVSNLIQLLSRINKHLLQPQKRHKTRPNSLVIGTCAQAIMLRKTKQFVGVILRKLRK